MATVKAKVVSRILGGLGNQLFCYAASRRLSIVTGAQLILDDISGFGYDKHYQRRYQLDHFHIPCLKATSIERMEPFPRVRRYLKRTWNARLPFWQRNYIFQEGIDFDQRILTLRPKGTLYLEGYWQSEDYFKDVELQIRADLRIKAPQDGINLQMAQRILQMRAISVHVRFFDETVNTEGNPSNLINFSRDYYKRAIDMIDRMVPGAHYFVFSDRPLEARELIPLADERMTIVHHNKGDDMAYADLWLMTQCQHFIIANSTFSWWGGWLAGNPDKVVIAPGFEKREGRMAWGFIGLIPEAWIKC